jgi:hypothetical protein
MITFSISLDNVTLNTTKGGATMRKILIVVPILLVAAGIAWAQGGMKKKKALPYEFQAGWLICWKKFII